MSASVSTPLPSHPRDTTSVAETRQSARLRKFPSEEEQRRMAPAELRDICRRLHTTICGTCGLLGHRRTSAQHHPEAHAAAKRRRQQNRARVAEQAAAAASTPVPSRQHPVAPSHGVGTPSPGGPPTPGNRRAGGHSPAGTPPTTIGRGPIIGDGVIRDAPERAADFACGLVPQTHCVPEHKRVVEDITSGRWERATAGRVHGKTVHEFNSSHSGVRDTARPNGKLQVRQRTALDWFLLFWSPSFEKKVLNHTVSHHARYGGPHRVRGDLVSPPTRDHLRVFLAHVIFMGLMHIPNHKLYWSHRNELVNFRALFGLMSINRFRSMRRHLSFADKWKQLSPDHDQYDKVYIVRPLIEQLNIRAKRFYYPHKSLAFDEGAFRCDAACPRGLRLDLRHKPCGGRGLQFEILADHATGMPWHIELYDKEIPGGIPKLVVNAANQLEQRFHVIYCDRAFTGPRCAVDLLRLGQYSCGTLDARRVSAPRQHILPDNAERGEERAVQRGQLLMMSVKDTGVVNLLTTYHQADERGHIRRWAGGPQRRQFECHRSLEDFNKFMTAVDKLRLLMSSYASSMPSQRWNLHVFYDVLNMMVTMSYIMQRESNGTAVISRGHDAESPTTGMRKLSHFEFRMALVRGLASSLKVKSSRSGLPAAATRLAPADHFPSREMTDAGRNRQYKCAWCRAGQEHLPSNARTHIRTTVKCKACATPLCISPCFEHFHKHTSPYDEGGTCAWMDDNPDYEETEAYSNWIASKQEGFAAQEQRLQEDVAAHQDDQDDVPPTYSSDDECVSDTSV